MLIRLVEIQKIAYSLERDRSQRPILRCCNLCFEFANLAIELFVDPKKPRSLFGMPFHSLVNHSPLQYKLVNGRSIVAEQAERHFSKFRLVEIILITTFLDKQKTCHWEKLTGVWNAIARQIEFLQPNLNLLCSAVPTRSSRLYAQGWISIVNGSTSIENNSQIWHVARGVRV